MDGVAFVIDMDNREIAVVHFGEANRYYTDERVESILDEGFNYMGDAEYADAMEAMIDEAEYYYGQGVPTGQYNYDEETGEYDYYEKNTLTWFEILITLLVALGIGGAFCGITIGKYRLHFDKYKYDYHKNSHVNLTNRTDRFCKSGSNPSSYPEGIFWWRRKQFRQNNSTYRSRRTKHRRRKP